MTDDVVIRAARSDDCAAVWPLARGLAVSFAPTRAVFEEVWRSVLGARESLVVVAFDRAANQVVGYLLAVRHPTFHADGPVVWVEEVSVRQDHRGSGVGRRLMEHVEQWAVTQGCAYVALATRRAAEFYTALGYEESASYFKKTLH